jgi:outer membrane protein OmpA-like peptidoglycan-associated protein
MSATKTNSRLLIGAAVATVLMAACSATPTRPAGSAALRARLIELQADPQLAGRAPLAMDQASKAVTAAEQPQADAAINAHLQFMADRKISIAAAEAHSQWSVDQRRQISEQRAAMQLNARTQEADAANTRTAIAKADASDQRRAADMANLRTTAAQADASDQRDAAEAANSRTTLAEADAAGQRVVAGAALDEAAESRRQSLEMQRQVEDLQARVTERGLVLTLGDVLFTTGTSDLRIGGDAHLARLAAFLNRYPHRSAKIEGHTDNVGGEGFNQGLSQRRAESVRSYLVSQGVDGGRLTATGLGEGTPVGDNKTATGRQQNRRVEVIIADEMVSSR